MSPPQIIPCAGALVYDDDRRLLLIKRAQDPGRGSWSLPGGRVDGGESAAAAMVREVFEETGLLVIAGPVIGVVERDGPEGMVYSITDFAAEIVGGTLHAGDDAAEARFVDATEMSNLALSPGLYDTLRQWQALPGGPIGPDRPQPGG